MWVTARGATLPLLRAVFLSGIERGPSIVTFEAPVILLDELHKMQ
jgi:hypothetical protein